MFAKVQKLAWHLKRPAYWPHTSQLVLNRLTSDRDTSTLMEAATDWARHKAQSHRDVFMKLGLISENEVLPTLPAHFVEEGKMRVLNSNFKMGGAGDIDLIYACAVLGKVRSAVETGVAYGWSSLAILAALEHNGGGQLVSVDRPYPRADSEKWVGVAVPDELRKHWTLVREPDRHGLKKALRILDGQIDMAHYDSDKSFWGRQYGYPLIWDALKPGGIFVSDDIQDNMAFADFVRDHDLDFGVIRSARKYVGIAVKPE